MPGGFATASDQHPCPCGGRSYGSCCAPLHRGERQALTAEQLMRSRYSAFVRGRVDYLMATYPEPSLPVARRRRELQQSCRQLRWLGLTILEVRDGGPQDLEGTVRFEARHQGGELRETSLFQRRDGCLDGAWLYIRSMDNELK